MSHRAFYPPAGFDRDAAAEYLSISPRKLDEVQAKGDLIPKKFGSRRIYRREDLEAFLLKLPDWSDRGTE